MKRVLSALLLLGIATGGALAQSDTTTNAPAGEPAPATDEDPDIVVEGDVPKEERRVCETRVQTGSIMPRRVCRTAAQAELEQRASEQFLENGRRDREVRDQIQLQRCGAPVCPR